MMLTLFTALLGVLPLTTAHFHLNYPYWRGDSFSSNPGITQYQFPCAGIDHTQSTNNRTLWPLAGGSLSFSGSHPSAITYVNLGLGTNVTVFNITLVRGFNQTGNGTFCWDHIPMNATELGIADGENASLQVIQIGEGGMALYNCADITVSSNATLLNSTQCFNATGVSGVALENVGSNATCAASNGSSGTSSASGSGSSSSSAAEDNKKIGAGVVVGAAAAGLALLI